MHNVNYIFKVSIPIQEEETLDGEAEAPNEKEIRESANKTCCVKEIEPYAKVDDS